MASTAFPSLSAPAADDTMEMSSPNPTNLYVDSDIEIDLDGPYDAIQFAEDEQMVEDLEQTRPGTATDEMMQDDEQPVTVASTEEIMHDEPTIEVLPQADEDDDLIDYEDEEYMYNQTVTIDEPVQNVGNDATETFTNISTEILEQPDGHVVSTNFTATGKESDAPTTNVQSDTSTVEDAPFPEPDGAGSRSKDATPRPTSNNTDSVNHGHPVSDGNAVKPADDDEGGEGTVSEDTEQEKSSNTEVPLVDSAVELPQSVDTSSKVQANESIPQTNTEVHPIMLTIVWGEDIHMPLFRSQAQPDGLLEDHSLLSASISNLLLSLRNALATEMEMTVSQDEHLLIVFESLELAVHEDTLSCQSTILNDLVELYLKLHQNDGTQDIPPFRLCLKPKSNFLSQLDFLKESAAQGQGISAINAMLDAVPYGVYVDDGDENGDENDFAEGDGQDQEHEHGDEHGTGVHDQEKHIQGNEYNHQDGIQHAEDPTEEYELDPTGEDFHAETETADKEHNDSGVLLNQEHEADGVEVSNQVADQLQPGIEKNDPAGVTKDTSVTAAKDLPGEYSNNADLIDWDDEYLTDEGVAPQTATGQDKPITLVTSSHDVDNHTQRFVSAEAKTVLEKSESTNAGSGSLKASIPDENGVVTVGDEDDLIDYSDDDYNYDDDEDSKNTQQTTNNNAEDEYEIDLEAYPTDDGAQNDDEQSHAAHDQPKGDSVDKNINNKQDFQDEDTIDFDDDEEEPAQVQHAKTPTKRSYDQLGNTDDDSPTDSIKKVRAT